MSSSAFRRAFYPLKEFPEMKMVQQHYLMVRKELQSNKTWIKWGSDDYDPLGHCKFLKGNWTICPVYFGNYSAENMDFQTTGLKKEEIGDLLKEVAVRFPETKKILNKCKSINFAAFSRLSSKTSLSPHAHSNLFSLIFHLGIMIPAGNSSGLMVNGQTHLWNKPGDAVIFDDNLTHSAWNDSEDEERVILYIDFLR